MRGPTSKQAAVTPEDGDAAGTATSKQAAVTLQDGDADAAQVDDRLRHSETERLVERRTDGPTDRRTDAPRPFSSSSAPCSAAAGSPSRTRLQAHIAHAYRVYTRVGLGYYFLDRFAVLRT